MKIFKGLFTVLLFLVIIGGIGYIVWMYYMPNMNITGINMPPNHPITPDTSQDQSNLHNMGPGAAENNTVPNIMAIQSKDKLNQAIGTINQAVDLITIDPYSRTTLPTVIDNNMAMNGNMQQPSAGTGTINIYPGGSSSVNIAPSGNIIPNNQVPATDTNMGTMNIQTNANFVYDQGKLQQVHRGIYTLAQGLMLLHELNDDLAQQSAMVEATPATYQTYIARYNLTLQNKTKLNNIINMLEQASILVNVNPYGAPGGYQVNMDGMGQLHQGIFKLAQGMTLLSRLNDDFTAQMIQATQQAQIAIGNSNVTTNLIHGNGFFNTMNISTIFNIILIVMVISLLISILGAIRSLFRTKPSKNISVDHEK